MRAKGYGEALLAYPVIEAPCYERCPCELWFLGIDTLKVLDDSYFGLEIGHRGYEGGVCGVLDMLFSQVCKNERESHTLPNSEGTSLFTPAFAAASIRAFCSSSPAAPTVSTTASMSVKACSRKEAL